MNIIIFVKEILLKIKRRFKENSFDNVFWIVNAVPTLAGFSLKKDTTRAPFWIIHISLLTYVYVVGNVVYQVTYAQHVNDFIKSFINVSLFVLIAVNTYWFMTRRPLLRMILKNVEKSDMLSKSSLIFQKKNEKMLSIIKYIVLIFYGANYFNATTIYLPNRVNVLDNSYSMQPCVGLEPLTSSPNREICMTILCLQEFSIMTVALNFQALFILLIAHTASMYHLLSDEIMLFASMDDSHVEAKRKLPLLISRHVLLLDTTNKLKLIYSMPLGGNWGSNAVCISLMLFLPYEYYISYSPITIYCFLTFFLYCFLCQRLINASEEFERAVYSCAWENFDLREKKSIYIMLLQAQKPIILLAADIIPLNMYTFASTIRGIYQFVTVVKL